MTAIEIINDVLKGTIRPLIFAPSRMETYGTRHFQNGAIAFSHAFGIKPAPLILFDNKAPKPKRRGFIVLEIAEAPPCNTFIFFSHGLAKSVQWGFDVDVDKLNPLAATIAANMRGEQNPIVVLYACSTAKGKKTGPGPGVEGGFADALRDALCREGLTRCTVFAHRTSGDSWLNPYAVVLEGNGSLIGGSGSRWVVQPHGPHWARYVALLNTTKLPWALPFMSAAKVALMLDLP